MPMERTSPALASVEMVYHLAFSETQRKLIENALRLAIDNDPDALISGTDADRIEYTMLREMIEDMPIAEAEEPGIVHGLCY